MTPPDDLLKPGKISTAQMIEYAKKELDAIRPNKEGHIAWALIAALESDRALLRRIVEAWDAMQARFGGDYEGRFAEGNEVIDEARARIGEGK